MSQKRYSMRRAIEICPITCGRNNILKDATLDGKVVTRSVDAGQTNGA